MGNPPILPQRGDEKVSHRSYPQRE